MINYNESFGNMNISAHIVKKLDSFADIYSRFTSLEYDYSQLLVVDDNRSLVGIIGVKQIDDTLAIADKHKIVAEEIMNNDFTYAIENSNIIDECFNIFYNNSFDIIPIVTDYEKKPTRLVHRKDYTIFNMISFSGCDELSFYEDVIFNYVLLDVSNIFYIDIGAFDPWLGNVTKWFSLSGRGHGINIEPQEIYYHRLLSDRPNDINIQVAISDKNEHLHMNICNYATTAREEYFSSSEFITCPAVTLSNICNKYIQDEQQIHILKIDVEGYEKMVLLGADFSKFRPWVIMLEATKPETSIPTHDEWEYILVNNQYSFAKQYGVNRFYVAKEHIELFDRFLDIEIILKRMNVNR